MQLIMSTDIGIKSMSSINQEPLKERETATDLVQEFIINDLTNANKGNIENYEHLTSECKETDSEVKLITESKPKDSKNISIDTNKKASEETPVDENISETYDKYDLKETSETNSKNDEDKNYNFFSESGDNIRKNSMDTDSSNIRQIGETNSNIDTDKIDEIYPESNTAKCDQSKTEMDENINEQKKEDSSNPEKEDFKRESISENILATHDNKHDITEISENISKIDEDENDVFFSESNNYISKDITHEESADMTKTDLIAPKLAKDMEIGKPNEEYEKLSEPNVEESEKIKFDNSDKDSLTDKLKDKSDLKNVKDNAECEIENTNSINVQNVTENVDNHKVSDDSNKKSNAISLQNADAKNHEDCDSTQIQSNLTISKNEENTDNNVVANDSTYVTDKGSSQISKDTTEIKKGDTQEDHDLHEKELKQIATINSQNTINISTDCMDCDDNGKIEIENTHDNPSLCSEESKHQALIDSSNIETETKNVFINCMACEDKAQESNQVTCQKIDENKDTEISSSVDDLMLCDDSSRVSDVIEHVDFKKNVEAQISSDDTNLDICKKEPLQNDVVRGKESYENKIKEAEILGQKNCDTYENKIPDNEIIDIGDEKLDIDQQDLQSLPTECASVDNNLKSDVTNQIVDVENDTSITTDTEINKNVSDKNIVNCAENKTNHKPQNILQDSNAMVIDKAVNHSDKGNQGTISDKKVKERKKLSLISKLSNTLDILSDEEDELSTQESLKEKENTIPVEKQCINIEDDDDIMLIDDEITSKDTTIVTNEQIKDKILTKEDEKDVDLLKKELQEPLVTVNETTDVSVKDIDPLSTAIEPEVKRETVQEHKPLLPPTFLKTCKKNLADMTREELEEFCIIKIVESVVDRSNLGEIKSQLKKMAHDIEEYKKKTSLQIKQNRDLQVVLKSVQEELKKNTGVPVTPLKITRSVGMQVLMADKGVRKRLSMPNTNVQNNSNNNNANNRQTKANAQTRKSTPLQIPVPRLVPASNTNNVKNVTTTVPATANNSTKTQRNNNIPNGVKILSPNQKPEKRSHDKMQQNNSVTVDLTDDEPPAKIISRNVVNPPVRCVPPQNLLAPKQMPSQPLNSPRKVYIPIGGPPNQGIRPGQTIMLKSIPPQNATGTPRPRAFTPKLVPNSNSIKMGRVAFKHPAPLPDSMKQYQPPNWKSLPPAPDLKLAKVENGIVISWKIDNFVEENHEEIASYQLFAYQETSSPPSTSLWKKIGDVKALPLPMACTLTQFMAGYKYYFAVRAVDIRSRFGPFSLPGSILLLNKV